MQLQLNVKKTVHYGMKNEQKSTFLSLPAKITLRYNR